jgi:Fe2+ transport system protein FeoA
MKPDLPTGDCACATSASPCCVVCPLSELGRGGCARVVGLSGAPRLQRRLMALGLHPSAELAVLGRGPNDGPMELRAGTVHLMLRACEAAGVMVEVASATASATASASAFARVPDGAHALPTV